MEMKFCTKCGKPLKPGVRFCAACGNKIVQPAEEVHSAPVEAPKPPQQPVAVEAPKNVEQPVIAEEPKIVQQPVQKPVQPAKAPAQKPAKAPVQKQPKAPKKSKLSLSRRSGGTLVLATLVCVFVFLFSIVLTGVIGLRNATTKESGKALAKTIIENVDITEVPAASLVADEDYEGSVADWIVEQAQAQSNIKEQFNKSDLADYLEDSEMVKQLSERIGALIWNIREDNRDKILDADELRELLEQDRRTIREHLNFELSDRDINNIINEMEEAEVFDYLNVRQLRREVPGAVYAVQYGLSIWAVLIVAALVVGFIVLLCLVNRWNILAILKDLGITLTVSGALLTIPTLFLVLFSGLVFQGAELVIAIDEIISSLAGYLLVPAAIMLAVGIVFTVVRALLKKVAVKQTV